MKHNTKKYLFQKAITDIDIGKGEKVSLLDKALVKKSERKGFIYRNRKGFVIKAFPINYNGKTALIPIPDLSLVYFDGAYNLNKFRKDKEKELFDKRILGVDKIGEDAINEIYRYYGFASSCVISLFTSIESFINHIIPNDKPYIKELKNKTEIFSKEQIQRNISFDEKTKKVLPYFFEK